MKTLIHQLPLYDYLSKDQRRSHSPVLKSLIIVMVELHCCFTTKLTHLLAFISLLPNSITLMVDGGLKWCHSEAVEWDLPSICHRNYFLSAHLLQVTWLECGAGQPRYFRVEEWWYNLEWVYWPLSRLRSLGLVIMCNDSSTCETILNNYPQVKAI